MSDVPAPTGSRARRGWEPEGGWHRRAGPGDPLGLRRGSAQVRDRRRAGAGHVQAGREVDGRSGGHRVRLYPAAPPVVGPRPHARGPVDRVPDHRRRVPARAPSVPYPPGLRGGGPEVHRRAPRQAGRTAQARRVQHAVRHVGRRGRLHLFCRPRRECTNSAPSRSAPTGRSPARCRSCSRKSSCTSTLGPACSDGWSTTVPSTSGSKAEAQAAVNKWYPRALDMFGHSNSDTSRRAIEYGLKRWTNEEARARYISEVTSLMGSVGLELPRPSSTGTCSRPTRWAGAAPLL